MKQNLFLLGSPFATLILTLSLLTALYFIINTRFEDSPGVKVPEIPAQELKPGEKHDLYNTLPPSSGWYLKRHLRDGFFTEALSDENIVYALREGKIGIFYSCIYGAEKPKLSSPESSNPSTISDSSTSSPSASSSAEKQQTPQEAQAVWAQVNRQNQTCGQTISALRKTLNKLGVKNIIIAPYPKIDSRVALVSWGRIDKLRWVDEKRIARFVSAYRKN